jgi:hypothetical protein
MVLWFQPNYYSVSAPQKQAGEPPKAVRFTAPLLGGLEALVGHPVLRKQEAPGLGHKPWRNPFRMRSRALHTSSVAVLISDRYERLHSTPCRNNRIQPT